MKRLLLSPRQGLILFGLLFLAGTASAQLQNMWTDTTNGYILDTGWVSFQKSSYQRMHYVEILNDDMTLNSPKSIYVAFEADTAAGRYFKLKSGEILTLENVNLAKLRLKAEPDSDSLAFRLRYH